MQSDKYEFTRNKIRFLTVLIVGISLLLVGFDFGGLPNFGADLGRKSVLGKEIRSPYMDMVSYFGYVAPGSEPDALVDGKKMYYLYLWIPAVAPEIGVRMISPVKGLAKPAKSDFVDPKFTANADTDDYFDVWVQLERCTAAINPADIAKPCRSWSKYGENDDSSELPAQPSGSKYNSLMRMSSVPSDPLKALVRGMYRVGFTSYKVGEVKGSFLAQVGAPVKLPGIAIARTPAELANLVK